MSDRASRIDGETLAAGQPGNVKRITIAAAAVSGTNTVATPYQMKPTDSVIIAVTALSDAAAIVTLPSVAEAAGKIYTIVAPTGATGGDISVYVKETGIEYTGQDSDDGDLDADNDRIVVLSDGINWNTLFNGVA